MKKIETKACDPSPFEGHSSGGLSPPYHASLGVRQGQTGSHAQSDSLASPWLGLPSSYPCLMPREDMRIDLLGYQPALPSSILQSSTSLYRRLLNLLFSVFNTARVFAYLPTLMALQSVGDSSQYSLVTWLCWTGANATMAAWLFEEQGRRYNKAILANIANAIMCALIALLIVCYRS